MVGAAGFSAGRADYTSLAIDSSGAPWVAYQDASNSGKASVMTYPSGDITQANVTMDKDGGSDPDGNTPLTYFWTQAGGPAVTLSDATVVQPTFTAPRVPPAVLSFTLTVMDSLGQTRAPDTVIVTATSAITDGNGDGIPDDQQTNIETAGRGGVHFHSGGRVRISPQRR